MICENCGEIFKTWNCYVEDRRFCSRKCYDEYKSQKLCIEKKQCIYCNEVFETYHRDQKYCSLECMHRDARDNSTKPLQVIIRGLLSSWKRKYLIEKKYTCEISGETEDVVLHHIHGFILIFNQAFEELNMQIKDKYDYDEINKLFDRILKITGEKKEYICISSKIHKQFHGIYGYGYNTKEQWDEFVKLNYSN